MRYVIFFVFSLLVFSFKGISQENKFDNLLKYENFKDSILSNGSFTVDELDTVVFDIYSGNFNSDFIEFPVSIISDDSIFSLDFSFEFNSLNYVFDTVYPLISPIQYLAHFNEQDLRLRFTSNSFVIYPILTPVVFVGFNILDFSFCELNFFEPKAYLNGDRCSVKITACPDPTSIDKIEASQLVYPNPVIGELYIAQPKASKVYISDNLGKIVFEKFNHQASSSISMEHFDAGMYFLKLETSSSIETFKIIVAK
jgi:hypothetical protein